MLLFGQNILSIVSYHNRSIYLLVVCPSLLHHGVPSRSWSYGSWINNYLCYQCLSPLKLWVRIPIRLGVLDTTLCDQVCQWLATGRWFSLGTPVPPPIKNDHHDITEILLKVALKALSVTLLYHECQIEFLLLFDDTDIYN